MAAYRYIVFPKGRQPTVEEVAELRSHATALSNRIAYGASSRDGALAMAFEADAFDRLLALDASFEVLIRRWELFGCEVVDHLAFVKDSTALRPARTAPRRASDALPPDTHARNDRMLAAKELAAKEAAARSRLDTAQSLQRYAALTRFGATMPYLLIGGAALATIFAGFYATNQLQNSGRERRKETIERVTDDAMRQPLAESESADHEVGPN